MERGVINNLLVHIFPVSCCPDVCFCVVFGCLEFLATKPSVTPELKKKKKNIPKNKNIKKQGIFSPHCSKNYVMISLAN